MKKIDELIEAFHKNIGCAEGEDGQYLLIQFERIKDMYYGVEERMIEISPEEQKKKEEETQTFYDKPGYKGD